MIALGHTAIGAAVGFEVYHITGGADPLTGLLIAGTAGMISHYITDIIPHGHFFVDRRHSYYRNTGLTILFDFLLGIMLFVAVPYLQEGLGWKFWYILFGIGGAQLPDILDNLIYLKILPKIGPLKLENNMHGATHWHGKNENGLLMGWRDLWQVTAVIASLYLISGGSF